MGAVAQRLRAVREDEAAGEQVEGAEDGSLPLLRPPEAVAGDVAMVVLSLTATARWFFSRKNKERRQRWSKDHVGDVRHARRIGGMAAQFLALKGKSLDPALEWAGPIAGLLYVFVAEALKPLPELPSPTVVEPPTEPSL